MSDSRLIRILVLGILLIIPFCGSAWLLDFSDHLERQRQSDHQLASLQAYVARFVRHAQPSTHYQDALLALRKALRQGRDPQSILATLASAPLRLTLFSAAGKRLSLPGFSQEFISASERCHALVLQTARVQNARLSPRDRKLADSFLGTFGAVVMLAENPGKLQNLALFGVDASAGIYPFRAGNRRRGSFIATLDHRKMSRQLLLQQARDRMQRLAGSSFTFGFGDLTHADFPEVIRRHLTGGPATTVFSDNGKIWCLAILDRRDLLYCHVSEIPALQPFVERHRLFVWCGLFFILLFLAAVRITERRGIPIRLRTGFLFAVSTLGSIAVLLGFGVLAVEAQRESLLRDRFDKGCEILAKADASYGEFLYALEKRYSGLVARIHPLAVNRASIASAAASLGSLEPHLSIIAIATSGAIIYSKESPVDGLWENLFGEQFMSTLGAMARQAMRQCSSEVTSGIFGAGEDLGKMSAIIRHGSDAMYGSRGRLSIQSFDRKDLTWYLDFIRGNDRFPVAALLIAHPHGFLEDLFVRRLSSRSRSSSPLSPFRFRTFPVLANGEIPAAGDSRRWLPPALIREMNDAVNQKRAPLMRVTTILGRSYLVAGYPCRHLLEQRLFLISPIADIEREARTLMNGLWGFAGLVLIFAAALSVAFARTLLEPMGSITQSLQRLGNSDFRFSISLRTGDEFETIGRGLQQTIDEMKELSLARNIQDHLLPPAPLKAPGYSCYGWTRSASEIGGEIFDFQELDDGRVAVWLAGAPGHSISSALLLGVYKMAVRVALGFPFQSPDRMIAELTTTFRERIPSFEQGRLAVGIFTPPTRSFSLASRGDIMVFHVRAGTPGTKPRTEVVDSAVAELQVGPGDRIFLLSEGCRGATSTAAVSDASAMASEETGPRILARILADASGSATRTTQTVLLIEVPAE